MVQICRLENIEHKNKKHVSYGGKYSLSASRVRHFHLQYSVVVGDAVSKLELYQISQRRKKIKTNIF